MSACWHCKHASQGCGSAHRACMRVGWVRGCAACGGGGGVAPRSTSRVSGFRKTHFPRNMNGATSTGPRVRTHASELLRSCCCLPLEARALCCCDRVRNCDVFACGWRVSHFHIDMGLLFFKKPPDANAGSSDARTPADGRVHARKQSSTEPDVSRCVWAAEVRCAAPANMQSDVRHFEWCASVAFTDSTQAVTVIVRDAMNRKNNT